MAYVKPLGDRVWSGRTQGDLDRGRQRVAELVQLVPEELCRSFVQATQAEIDQMLEAAGASVLTPSPTVVAEFAERIMDGVDPAQATELREFVDSVHLHRKLPEPNPEQMAEHQRNVLAQEVEHVRHSLVREWLNRYGSVTRQQRGESIPLDEDLWPAYLSERKRDLILPMNDNALGGDGAFQVYRAFAANIRKLVDGSPDGYEVFDDAGTKLVIRHDGVSYVLVRMQSD